MTIERETFSELLHAMLFAYAGGDLRFSQITSVVWACAQPNTTEEVVDITHTLRSKLTDWSELDKGMIIVVETVMIKFPCVNVHGPCKKGTHTVQMTRVIGSTGWEPEQVSSIHAFNDVIIECLPVQLDLDDNVNVIDTSAPRRGGSRADLISAFREMFMNDDKPIDQEVKDFRKELDELFPSVPSEKGGSDDSP